MFLKSLVYLLSLSSVVSGRKLNNMPGSATLEPVSSPAPEPVSSPALDETSSTDCSTCEPYTSCTIADDNKSWECNQFHFEVRPEINVFMCDINYLSTIGTFTCTEGMIQCDETPLQCYNNPFVETICHCEEDIDLVGDTQTSTDQMEDIRTDSVEDTQTSTDQMEDILTSANSVDQMEDTSTDTVDDTVPSPVYTKSEKDNTIDSDISNLKSPKNSNSKPIMYVPVVLVCLAVIGYSIKKRQTNKNNQQNIQVNPLLDNC